MASRNATAALRRVRGQHGDKPLWSLLAAATSIVWTADDAGAFVEPQPSWEAYTGQPWDDHRGRGWLRMIHPNDREEVASRWGDAQRRPPAYHAAGRIWHAPTRAYRYCRAYALPLRTDAGILQGWAGFTSEAREPAPAERSFPSTDTQLTKVLESISDAFSAMDRHWRYTYVNPQWTRLTGVRREDAIGTVAWDLFPEAVAMKTYEVAQQAMRDQVPVVFEDYNPRLRIWFETRLQPTPNGMLGLTMDITDRKRIEEERRQLLEREKAARQQAEDASRQKDDFLAVLSHELRTPLNAMLGWLQMMRKGNLDSGKMTHALEVIDRNAHSQAQLVGDLLDLSRIITGHLRLQLRPVHAGPVVQATIDAVRPAADNKNIRIDASIDESVVLVCDSERLQQIVWNVLSNAVKFTPRQGRVQVDLTRADGDAVIRINDTGEGISPEFLPYLFDRFRQADSGSRRAHSGLGLGLALVRQLTEAHGGTVAAESPGPGAGSTFTVRLPIGSGTEASPPPRRVRKGERMDLRDVSVLLVEDNPDARELLSILLHECSATVSEASDAEEGLALLHEGHHDVLIADIGMPGQDGYDLIRAVRQRSSSAGGRIPAIAVTAYSTSKDRHDILAAGYDAHVTKPVDPAHLYAAIANVLGRTADTE